MDPAPEDIVMVGAERVTPAPVVMEPVPETPDVPLDRIKEFVLLDWR